MDTDYKKALEGCTIKEVRRCDDEGFQIRLDNGMEFSAWVFYNRFEGVPFTEYSLVELLVDCPKVELIERER